MPLVNPGSTKGQTRSKSSQNNTFHGFLSNPSFSEIFGIKFDLNLTLGGAKNPNFDLAIRMSWNQFHCEDYQILIPTTIHGLKSKLERPRYHKNQDNTSIDALLTSESHNFWYDRWIFKIHTFSKTGSQNLSRNVKINPIHGLLKVAALEGLSPWKSCRVIKGPRHPSDQKKKKNK